MKSTKKLFTAFGNRSQSAVADSNYKKSTVEMPSTLRFGRIKAVLPKDNLKNKVGKYVTYDVMLSPNGVVIEDVPACSTGGQIVDFNTPDAPALTTINTEETPFVVGQPVLVGFVSGSNMNPIIISAVGSQFNASSETTAQHPRKSGSFQGLTWFIDKTGNPNVTVPSSGNLTVVVGTTTLLTISNGLVQIGTGSDVGVLGNALVSYLNAHTHSGVQTGGGVSGPPVTPATGITTSVLKVQ